jgi:probable rRNA maturation factor
MVEVDLDQSDEWNAEQDWQTLSETAVTAAFGVAAFAPSLLVSLSIKLSDNGEVQTLNAEWRGKDKPTNVLSFPMLEAGELHKIKGTEVLLGDIILAQGVCVAEAKEKGIPLADHVAHLIVHGTLHLLGYDHVDDAEAETMEMLEVKALASLGIANPYSDH